MGRYFAPVVGCAGFRPPFEMTQPKVSVLITNFNYDRFVADAVRSALSQTYDDLEIVVCDDGSTDRSLEVLSEFGDDPRVRVLEQPNAGQGAAISHAASVAGGDILCFLDADDTFLPSKVERVVQAFEAAPRVGLVVHRVEVVDHDGRSIQQIPQFASLRGGNLRDEVLARGGRWVTVPSSALAIRSAWGSSIFPVPSELRTGADAFVFGLMPLLAEVAALDEALTHYRVHDANAYGTTRVDAATARHALSELELVTGLVNERLAALGQDLHVDLERNLYWHQHRANLALLEPASRSEAVAASDAFLARLRTDDLWPQAIRSGLSFIYKLAPRLPLRARGWWLNLALGLSRAKRSVGRMMRK